MGSQIEMVSVVRPRFSFYKGNSISLSARAASQCLDDAGVDPGDIGILINTGIYRHKNIGEPAIAALIQENIGANTVIDTDSGNFRSTFSFDLNNGGCGWLTGIHIIHESINTEEISCGMVVTGDSDPFPGLSQGFAFETAAAAIILVRSNDPKGFTLFRSYTFPEYSQELVSHSYYGHLRWKRNGNNLLLIQQKDSYLDLCVKCAAESLFSFLRESGYKFKDINLIIPSQSPDGFVHKLMSIIGLSDSIIEVPKTGNRILHTAGPAFALKKAWDDNRFKASKRVILITVGSGINVSVALYEN
jgi:3-oxoacyl-[acyl-carrier-protein] synthase-3